MPLRFSIVFLGLMLIYPQDSLAAARDAFTLWQQTVAPSLLPFFALIPALTCPEATACFARLLKYPCRLLAIPEEFAGAVGIALATGSPAGARALMRIAKRKPYPAETLFRTALLCAGVSPGFLISGVGAGMLGAPTFGAILLLSQLLALCCSARLLQLARLPDTPLTTPAAEDETESSPILYAAQGALSILVWMVLFGVGTHLAQQLLPWCAAFIPFPAEFSSGCAHAVSLGLPTEQMLPLLGAIIGFGGLCAGFQNLSALKPLGIPAPMYFLGKLIHAALTALFARLLVNARLPDISFAPQHMLPVLAAICLLPLLMHNPKHAG